MSTATDWAWTIKGLDPTTRVVLMALAKRSHNITYECFPAHKLIAADSEVSVATVKRCLDKLIDRQIINSTPRTRPGTGGQTSNIYCLNVKVDYHQPDGSIVEEKAVAQNELGVAQNELGGQLTGELPVTPKKELSSRAKALSGRATGLPSGAEEHAFRVYCVQWTSENKNWSPWDAGAEYERFTDNAIAKGSKYIDWQAAWRNWCRSPYCKTTSPEAAATAYRKEPLRV